MFLQRLYELRLQLGDGNSEAHLSAEGYKKQRVHWVVEVDQQGAFLQLSSLNEEESPTPKKKAKKRGLPLDTPYFIRAGKKPLPFLLVDKSTYLFGVTDPDPKKKKSLSPQEAHQLYLALMQELVDSDGLSSEERSKVEAWFTFLTSNEVEKAAQDISDRYMPCNDKGAKINKELVPLESDLFAPRVDGEFLHTMKGVQRFWSQRLREGAERPEKSNKNKETKDAPAQKALRCMLTGEEGVVELHPGEFVLSGQPTSLISANSSAYESYGLRRSQNAPLSLNAARMYGEALNYLLGQKRHHYSLSNVTYVFWARTSSDDFFSLLLQAQPEEVRRFLQKVHQGKACDGLQADEFYVAALTVNRRRLAVRDYLEMSLSQMQDKLARWFDGHAIIDAWQESGPRERTFRLRDLAGAFARFDQKKGTPDYDSLSPQIMPLLLKTALTGVPLPLSLLGLLIQRLRAEKRILPAQAAMLRLILNGTKCFSSPERTLKKEQRPHSEKSGASQEVVVTVALNPEDYRPAYLCGRLFAVLESVQRTANPGTKATIADRFIGSASSAPASVFGRLLRGAQPHLQKLLRDREGAYHALQRRLEGITSHLISFPRTLSLEEQGLFSLGYYHQRHADYQAVLDAKSKKQICDSKSDPEKETADHE